MFRVSDNHRFLSLDKGAPFFWLADTGWAVAQRLDRDESLEYLDKRAAQGFNVAQVVGISEFDGLREGNWQGEVPLVDLDPTRPNPAYWQHVRWLAGEGARRGVYLALLPTWGDKWNRRGGVGPEVFTPDGAGIYGQWLGEFFRDTPLFWVLGGDRPVETPSQLETIRAMARGLRAGDGGAHLCTFHPPGGTSSAKWFHQDEWLDFNLQQSGHSRPQVSTAPLIEEDYNRTPTKPVIDGEPRYEDHPIAWNWERPDLWDTSNGFFDDLDARKAAYMALFSGACGHTYGANSVFQCDKRGVFDGFGSRRTWRQALDLPGAWQMQHAKRLLEARAFFSRIPAQNILRGELGEGSDELRATRDSEGSFALVYVPSARAFEVDLTSLRERARASWFDPRTGESHAFSEVSPAVVSFESPQTGPDWVLCVDANVDV